MKGFLKPIVKPLRLSPLQTELSKAVQESLLEKEDYLKERGAKPNDGKE